MRRAFSLLEVLIVVGLLGLVAAVVLKGTASKPDTVEVAALADTVAAELRSAAQRARTNGYPVALVIPSEGGSRPHSQSLYRVEGAEPRIVDIRDFSGDFKRSCIAAGLVYPAGSSTVSQPSDGGNGSTFNLVDWVGDSALDTDYVVCFTPSGSVVTNDLPVVDGSFKLLVAYGIRYSAAGPPSGTGWGIPPSYFRLEEVGAGKILSISPSGQVEVEPLDPNTGIAVVPQLDFSQPPATLPPLTVAGSANPNILDIQVFPVPKPGELPAGVEALVDINRHLSFRVVAEDSDAERQLVCRWESDQGGPFSKPDWHPMTWEPDGAGTGNGAWVSQVDWKPPLGTAVGTEFTLTATVRDPAGNTDSDLVGATGTIEAVDNSLIVYVSDQDGSPALYGMMHDGSDVHRVSDLNGGTDPRLTYNGDRVFFQRNGSLYIQETAGGQPVELTSPGGATETGSFTTDGTRVFWSTFPAYTAELNGNDPVTPYNLCTAAEPGFIGQYGAALTPAISADSRKLAYTAFVDFDQCIVVADFDENGPPFLPGPASPVYSSLGSNGPEGDRQVWSPVLEPPVAGQPDRRKLFYQSKSGGNFDIYSVIIDYDTNRSYLDAPPVRLTNSPGRDLRPAVSPDGTRIVFYSDRTGNNEIFRMDVDGTNLVQLTDNDSSEHTPTWGN